MKSYKKYLMIPIHSIDFDVPRIYIW